MAVQSTEAEQPEAPRKERHARLGLKIGSRLVPILLTLFAFVLFAVNSLPSGLDAVAKNIGISEQAPSPVTLKYLGEAVNDPQLWGDVIKPKIGAFTWREYFTKLGAPLAKGSLDEFAKNSVKITTNFLWTALMIGLYSLIPGIAGLVYRRSFWPWYLTFFVGLLILNASDVFGNIAEKDAMPPSGTVFLFLVGQVILLILANRLRRYSNSAPGAIPSAVFNYGLAAILTIIGVACVMGWGPGYQAAVVEKLPDGSAGAVLSPKIYSPMWAWLFGTGFSGQIFKWEFLLVGLPLLYTLFRSAVRWEGTAPKNIVVLLDGTSNTPDQKELGLLAQTNVFKLFTMLKADGHKSFLPGEEFDASLCKKYEKKQIAFYYAGVGNKFDNDPITQTFGLAGGLGAAAVVERAYLDVVRVYRPGDKIFIAGFSRGAAIARLLARTIDARGAPRSVWSLHLFGRHRTLWTVGKRKKVPVAVLGCWDTVGAFGIGKTIAGIDFQKLDLFKDLTVPETVERAYHMLALDERRDSFEPTLMDPDPITPERIVEVWFSGDHANIGGGWATDRLSDITMDFLLRHTSSGYAAEANMAPGNEAWGLYLDGINGLNVVPTEEQKANDVSVIYPDPMGQLRMWSSMLYTYRPRKLPLHAVVSETVFERMSKVIPVYAPEALFKHNKALGDRRSSIDVEVARLMGTNSLSDDERDAILDAKTKLLLTRWPQHRDKLNKEREPVPPEKRLSNVIALAAAATVREV